VRTRRTGNIGEGIAESGRGLQIENRICPTEHQLGIQRLKIEVNGRWPLCYARRILDRRIPGVADATLAGDENVAAAVQRNGKGASRSVEVGPQRHAST